MDVIAVANAKGGTCKTSLAVNLADGFARRGMRTLLADLDPQANATHWLIEGKPLRGAADVLLNASPPTDGELVQVPGREGLVLLPSTPAMAGVDLALARAEAGDLSLRRALEPLSKRFDVVILDCPPNLGLTVLTAIRASDGIVVPVVPAWLSIVGLTALGAAVARVKNRKARLLGHVLCAVDARVNVADEARDLLRQQDRAGLYRAEVRISTAATTLPMNRQTAFDKGADARGAQDYPAVVAETLKRLHAA